MPTSTEEPGGSTEASTTETSTTEASTTETSITEGKATIYFASQKGVFYNPPQIPNLSLIHI